VHSPLVDRSAEDLAPAWAVDPDVERARLKAAISAFMPVWCGRGSYVRSQRALGRTLQAIATELGVTRERVRQIDLRAGRVDVSPYARSAYRGRLRVALERGWPTSSPSAPRCRMCGRTKGELVVVCRGVAGIEAAGLPLYGYERYYPRDEYIRLRPCAEGGKHQWGEIRTAQAGHANPDAISTRAEQREKGPTTS